jgi:drug/metabolite transporter (DMT)-like permease
MTKLHDSEQKAVVFAILSVFFWATVATAFKITLRYTDPITLLAFSSFFSLIILSSVLIIQGKWKALLIQSRKDWLFSMILGALNPFLYYLILFNAYNLLRAQEAMVLNYTWPLVLSVFSAIFLKRKISVKGYLALFISFFGIIIIATKGNILDMNFESPLGISLAIGSAGVWASYWILNILDKREPVLKLTSGFIFGTIFSFVYLAFTSGFRILNIEMLAGTAYIGTFEMGLTFIFWLTALSQTKRTEKINQLVYISPFLSLIFISLILKEQIQIYSGIGLIFIIGGILLQTKLK